MHYELNLLYTISNTCGSNDLKRAQFTIYKRVKIKICVKDIV